MDAVEQKRGRNMVDAMGTFEDAPVAQDTRRHVEDFHPPLAIDKEVVKEHAQLRGPGMGANLDAAHAPPLEGVHAATPN